MLAIKPGENAIIKKDVYGTGALLLLSSLVSAKVDIMFNSKILATYTYPSTYLRQGDTTSQLELEISSILSADFRPNTTIDAQWTLVKTNSEFSSTEQKDIIKEAILMVE
jgi:hypothetical protein